MGKGRIKPAVMPIDRTGEDRPLSFVGWIDALPVPAALIRPMARGNFRLHASNAAGTSPFELVRRHAAGDWGDLCSEDRRENVYAIRCGFRLLSTYVLSTGERVWIITEADRTVTTVLLPSEY